MFQSGNLSAHTLYNNLYIRSICNVKVTAVIKRGGQRGVSNSLARTAACLPCRMPCHMPSPSVLDAVQNCASREQYVAPTRIRHHGWRVCASPSLHILPESPSKGMVSHCSHTDTHTHIAFLCVSWSKTAPRCTLLITQCLPWPTADSTWGGHTHTHTHTSPAGAFLSIWPQKRRRGGGGMKVQVHIIIVQCSPFLKVSADREGEVGRVGDVLKIDGTDTFRNMCYGEFENFFSWSYMLTILPRVKTNHNSLVNNRIPIIQFRIGVNLYRFSR